MGFVTFDTAGNRPIELYYVEVNMKNKAG